MADFIVLKKRFKVKKNMRALSQPCERILFAFLYVQHQFEYLFFNALCYRLPKRLSLTWRSSYVDLTVDKRTFYILPFIFEFLFNAVCFKNIQRKKMSAVKGLSRLPVVRFGLLFDSVVSFAYCLFNVQLYKDFLKFTGQNFRFISKRSHIMNRVVLSIRLFRLSSLVVPFFLIEEDTLANFYFNALTLSVYDRSCLWSKGRHCLLRTVYPFFKQRV